MSQKNTKKCHRCKPGTKKIASINSKWKLPHLFMEISPKYAMPECSPDLQNYHHKKANLHEEVDLGEYVDEFEDVLKSRLNVVDDFGLQGEDLKNNTEIFNKLKDLIKEIKLDEIDRKDLLIDRLELFLQRDCFVDCK